MAEPMDHSGATNKAIMCEHMYECGLVLKKSQWHGKHWNGCLWVIGAALSGLVPRGISEKTFIETMSVYSDHRPITEALGCTKDYIVISPMTDVYDRPTCPEILRSCYNRILQGLEIANRVLGFVNCTVIVIVITYYSRPRKSTP